MSSLFLTATLCPKYEFKNQLQDKQSSFANTHTEIASYRGYLAPIVWFNKTLEVSQSAVQKLVGTYLTASTSLFLYSSE